MTIHRQLIIAFLSLVIQFHLSAQEANSLIHSVYGKLIKAKNYSVQANIKVDMPFIRILPVDVKIFYKQPDKFKVESKSIAIVPRQGFDQLSGMLSDTNAITTIIQGEEKIGTTRTQIISIIPLADTCDLILGKFWIDPSQKVILKSQLTTRSSGTIITEYYYGSQIDFGLPDQMIFSVDAGKFRMPKNLDAEATKSENNKDSRSNGDKKGKIYITLTNYKVNQGIPDSIFTESK